MSYKDYLNEFRNIDSISKEELQTILTQFSVVQQHGIVANMLFYILNISRQNYEHVSPFCEGLTGYSIKDFKTQGTSILPKIMIEEDFNALASTVFPEMNKIATSLDNDKISNAVFELYYRFKNIKTNKITSIVEYSSYTKFNNKMQPVLSSGVCLESPHSYNGVRGIIRIKNSDRQDVLYDKKVMHETAELTKRQKEIISLIAKGYSSKEIAEELFIGVETVHTHRKNIMKLLKLKGKGELVKYALKYI